MIWIPTRKGDKDAPPAPEPEATEGEQTGKRSGFVMGTVFDVSQTEPERGHIDRQRMDELAQDAADVGNF